MTSGNLKFQITLQNQGSSVDGFGQPTNASWEDFATVRASIRPTRGTEKFLSNADYATVSHTVMIRYIDGVNSSMRIKWIDRGVERYLRILNNYSVMEKDKWIAIYAEEEINGN